MRVREREKITHLIKVCNLLTSDRAEGSTANALSKVLADEEEHRGLEEARNSSDASDKEELVGGRLNLLLEVVHYR